MTTHRETAYLEHSEGLQLSVSEDVSDQSIIIPLYVPMTKEEITYVIQQITSILTNEILIRQLV
jgi:perosamine synthetase